MNSYVGGWQLLAAWMIIVVLIGGTIALLERNHRRAALPRPRPEHSAGAADADQRRLRTELSTAAESSPLAQPCTPHEPTAGVRKPDAEPCESPTGTARVPGWLTTTH